MLGTPSWTPQEANFVTSDRLRAIAGLEEVKGCRVAQADLTRVLPAPLRTCSAQSVKENPLVDQRDQGLHWRARTTCARRRQPQRLDHVLYSTILSAETPARCHIRALLQPLARPRARAPRQAHGRPWQAHPGTLRSLSQLGPGRVVERSARRRTVKWRPWAAATAGKKARHSWPPIPHRA